MASAIQSKPVIGQNSAENSWISTTRTPVTVKCPLSGSDFGKFIADDMILTFEWRRDDSLRHSNWLVSASKEEGGKKQVTEPLNFPTGRCWALAGVKVPPNRPNWAEPDYTSDQMPDSLLLLPTAQRTTKAKVWAENDELAAIQPSETATGSITDTITYMVIRDLWPIFLLLPLSKYKKIHLHPASVRWAQSCTTDAIGRESSLAFWLFSLSLSLLSVFGGRPVFLDNKLPIR